MQKNNETKIKKVVTAHSRKVKKRHASINISLWNIPAVQDKVKSITKMVQKTKENKIKADTIQVESQNIIKNSPPLQQLLEELSVATLHDIHDIETKGSVQKLDFFDVSKVGAKRREIIKIVESNEETLANIRETQIEVLQLQVAKLLEEMEEK